MIELAAPRPMRPDQTHRRIAINGEIIDVRTFRVPIRRTDVEIALDKLRDKMAARIDAAFACHTRHHLRDIERRFKYADRPDLRVFDVDSRRILGELSIAVLRGEL